MSDILFHSSLIRLSFDKCPSDTRVYNTSALNKREAELKSEPGKSEINILIEDKRK